MNCKGCVTLNPTLSHLTHPEIARRILFLPPHPASNGSYTKGFRVTTIPFDSEGASIPFYRCASKVGFRAELLGV
jgi:hypothetical protein